MGGGSKWICVRIHCFLFKGIGDMNLAHQCFRLALVNNNHHAEAYNNLAVLEMRKGHVEQVSELLWHSAQSAFLKEELSGVAIFTCCSLFVF